MGKTGSGCSLCVFVEKRDPWSLNVAHRDLLIISKLTWSFSVILASRPLDLHLDAFWTIGSTPEMT